MADEQTYSVAKIDLNKRPANDRPKEFSKTTGELFTINSDFEKWLILALDSVKKELSSYFENISGEESERSRTKNELHEKFKTSRANRYLADFNFFEELSAAAAEKVQQVESVRISEKTSISSSSVDKMIDDIQTFILNAEHKRSNAKFLYDITLFLTNVSTLNIQSSTSIQQFRSWPNILQAYLKMQEPDL